MVMKTQWVKIRKPISPYPKTPQQKSVRVGGLLVKEVCTGKKGKEFFRCRSEVLKCAFDDGKCREELLRLKSKLLGEVKVG